MKINCGVVSTSQKVINGHSITIIITIVIIMIMITITIRVNVVSEQNDNAKCYVYSSHFQDYTMSSIEWQMP